MGRAGTGAPILSIMGLGYPSAMWHRTRPALSASYRTIALDNRGAAESDVPPGPYSIALMASDAAVVLDAAGVRSAHVFGVSMGGMIAQEFAFAVSRACAVSHSRLHSGRRNERAARRTSRSRDVESPHLDEPGRSSRGCGPFYLPLRDAAAVNRRRYRPASAVADQPGRLSCSAAGNTCVAFQPPAPDHGSNARNHGKLDRLVPVGNGELIATRIPGAKLVLIERASHLFSTDQPEAAETAILEFLAAQLVGAKAGE